jgi:hypothetical protein
MSLKYFNPEIWPGLYSDLPQGMKFKGRVLGKIEDIVLDIDTSGDKKSLYYNFFMKQSGAIRMYSVGENADEVRESLNDNGFEFNHVPIAVALIKGQLMILDGRTRLWALKKAGFENVIYDLYEIDEWMTYFKVGLKRNPKNRPSSPMTKADVINNCNNAIENGWLKREWEDIMEYVLDVTEQSFKPEVVRKIVHNVMYGIGYTAQVVSFTKESATAWLKRNGYIDNQNNNGIYYEVFASSAYSKAVAGAAKRMFELEDEGKLVKELRIIIHTGTLEGSNPIISWEDALDSFRKGWSDDLSNIQSYFFGSASFDSRIKLYGAVPAVQQLSQIYNMDKLVMFHVGQLKNNSFSQIRMEENLKEQLVA